MRRKFVSGSDWVLLKRSKILNASSFQRIGQYIFVPKKPESVFYVAWMFSKIFVAFSVNFPTFPPSIQYVKVTCFFDSGFDVKLYQWFWEITIFFQLFLWKSICKLTLKTWGKRKLGSCHKSYSLINFNWPINIFIVLLSVLMRSFFITAVHEVQKKTQLFSSLIKTSRFYLFAGI